MTTGPELYDEATASTYARGALGSSSGFGNHPSILLVDYCLGMTDPASPLGSDVSDAIKATIRLLEVARAQWLPVAYTTVRYSKGCRDGGAFVEKIPSLRIFEEGGPWSAIDPRVVPQAGEPVLLKKFASAFFGTGLASLLTSQMVDTVIVTGFTTSGCVRASALDALQSGFRVVVPRECVADRAPGPHAANLFDLHAKYADVMDLDDVLEHLRRLRVANP